MIEKKLFPCRTFMQNQQRNGVSLVKETGFDYSKEQEVMSGVLGGNLNFARYERETLWSAEKNVTKCLASKECDWLTL